MDTDQGAVTINLNVRAGRTARWVYAENLGGEQVTIASGLTDAEALSRARAWAEALLVAIVQEQAARP